MRTHTTQFTAPFSGPRGKLHLLLQERNNTVPWDLRLKKAEMKELADIAEFRQYRTGENLIDRGTTRLRRNKHRGGTSQPLRLFFPLMAYTVRVINAGQQEERTLQPGDFTGDRAARVDPIVFSDDWDPKADPVDLVRTNPVQAKVDGQSAFWDMNNLSQALREKLRTICEARSAMHRSEAAPPGDERGELPTGAIQALDAGWQDPNRTIEDGPTEDDTMDHGENPANPRGGFIGWIMSIGRRS